jgi:hypothetical protein
MSLEGPESDRKAGLKGHRPFLASVLVGLALILMSLALMAVFPAKAPELPRGFLTPLIAFEFVSGTVICALVLGLSAFFHPGIVNELFSLAIMVIFLLTIFSCLTSTRQITP